jgi:formylglycine-generating enzyme required for sulfatase activity
MISRFATAALVALCFATLTASLRAELVTIDWVTVGDPDNAADTTGYGRVAESYRIMSCEWTNDQYVAFLNAVDPNGTNPNSIYSNSMGSRARGGISFTSGNTAGSKYAAKTNMGDKPVNYVSWWDAARVANWLQNGQGSGSTEMGAYTLNNATSGDAPAVNPGAQFYVPTENQWYKAAYYAGSGTNAGYWDYATQSDIAPTAVTADSTGIGSAGSTGNSANLNLGADWNLQDGNVTTVGTNGGASAYGAFDMSGNVSEWNDLAGAAGSSRGFRGGNWSLGAYYSSSSYGDSIDASGGGADLGFRLASPVAVPEPATWMMGLAGIACAGWGAYRRRRALNRRAAPVRHGRCPSGSELRSGGASGCPISSRRYLRHARR